MIHSEVFKNSLSTVESDTIMVTEIAPDQFELTLSERVTLTVGRSDKGNFEVSQSRGLFSFPEDKIDLAKKTGMWEEGLTDVELNERIKDDDFFEYLNNSIQYKISNIITIGKFKSLSDGGTMGMGTQTLTNNSDVDLDGSEYSIVSNWTYIDYAAPEEEEEEKGTSVTRGYPIKAHGTYTDHDVYSGYHGTGIINKINGSYRQSNSVRNLHHTPVMNTRNILIHKVSNDSTFANLKLKLLNINVRA